MKLNLESIIPLLLIILVCATIYFNNSTPTESINGYAIVKPKIKPELLRGIHDVKEEDNVATVNHIDRPDDKLNFHLWHDYIVFPKDDKGEPIIPTRKSEDGTKDVPIWNIRITRKEFVFDPGWDIGTYAGYLSGPKEGTDIKPLNVGIRFSPLRIWNTFATDFLLSNQGGGAGISFYPAPERFGEFWNHLGVGYGRIFTFSDGGERNLFYLSLSTRF